MPRDSRLQPVSSAGSRQVGAGACRVFSGRAGSARAPRRPKAPSTALRRSCRAVHQHKQPNHKVVATRSNPRGMTASQFAHYAAVPAHTRTLGQLAHFSTDKNSMLLAGEAASNPCSPAPAFGRVPQFSVHPAPRRRAVLLLASHHMAIALGRR